MATNRKAYSKIRDVLTGALIDAKPEELVRQNTIQTLIKDYKYDPNQIDKEIPIQCGSSILKDRDGKDIRADIVVYNSQEAKLKRDQGNILFVVECKSPSKSDGYNQLVSYIYNTSASGGVWTNGNDLQAYRVNKKGLDQILSIPRNGVSWKSDEPVLKKCELTRPQNIRLLLSSCHNKLYGRGMENEDFDLTMDMVRILLAKIQDETDTDIYPSFWITEEQYSTQKGRKYVATIVQKLFRKYADNYPEIFETDEKIQVGPDCIAEVVGILQRWELAARQDSADEWDLMGEAYEQFTHITLKRQQGQFFTNRLVVDMITDILNPTADDKVLDPAGGSGGFATALFRKMRRNILNNTPVGSSSRERQLSLLKDKVFLVEIAGRLVKIAKCAMLLTGDGQSGMTKGNSLLPYDQLDPWIVSRCSGNTSNSPTIIATNPPFSGQKVDSMISDPTILKKYTLGHKFKKIKSGYEFETEDHNLQARQAPELLFLEKCIDWVSPGGLIGIVLPKGILDNKSYEPYRYWLLQHVELRGVVTLHKDTFQPDTGVRTCVLFLRKPEKEEALNSDYPIFMAISRKIGQDSKGNKIYIKDKNGLPTTALDHDLDLISKSWNDFQMGNLIPSENIFSINRSDIKDFHNINPQHYLPKLNEAAEIIAAYDEKDGWYVSTIGQLETDVSIYLGPRWNPKDLCVDEHEINKNCKPYLTANQVLEVRRQKMKWMDLSKANPKQKNVLKQLEVQEGDILVSRSGTIGKIAYVTSDLADNYIISDDLIRIRLSSEDLRAYVLNYLMSSLAQQLLQINEYGSVQQHLQPRHLIDMPIPVPENWNNEMAVQMINNGKAYIKALVDLAAADQTMRNNIFDIQSLED